MSHMVRTYLLVLIKIRIIIGVVGGAVLNHYNKLKLTQQYIVLEIIIFHISLNIFIVA